MQKLGGVGTSGLHYSPLSFAPVSAGRFGNIGRNILRNPGMSNTDVSIVRVFPIREQLQLQFRTEFYDLPNTPHFKGFGGSSDITDTNFGRLTSSFGERNIRFALRVQW